MHQPDPSSHRCGRHYFGHAAGHRSVLTKRSARRKRPGCGWPPGQATSARPQQRNLSIDRLAKHRPGWSRGWFSQLARSLRLDGLRAGARTASRVDRLTLARFIPGCWSARDWPGGWTLLGHRRWPTTARPALRLRLAGAAAAAPAQPLPVQFGGCCCPGSGVACGDYFIRPNCSARTCTGNRWRHQRTVESTPLAPRTPASDLAGGANQNAQFGLARAPRPRWRQPGCFTSMSRPQSGALGNDATLRPLCRPECAGLRRRTRTKLSVEIRPCFVRPRTEAPGLATASVPRPS